MTSILDIDSDVSDSDDENYVPNRTGDTSESSSGEEEDEGCPSTRNNGKSCDLKSKSSNETDQDDEKPKISEEDRKKHEDELFKKFMEEVKQETKTGLPEDQATKVTVTEEYEFAGETVKVTKEIDQVPENSSTTTVAAPSQSKAVPPTRPLPAKRAGGLSSLVGALDKKKQKLSTLEKSRLDWNSFKKQEGIEEDLQTHNKGKEGYLERQAFLQRSDFRQFERERELRLSGKRK